MGGRVMRAGFALLDVLTIIGIRNPRKGRTIPNFFSQSFPADIPRGPRSPDDGITQRITDNDRFSSRRRIGAWPSRASTNESRDTFRTGPRGVKNDRCGVPSIDVRTIIVSRQIRRFGSEIDHSRALPCPYNGDVRKVVATRGGGFISRRLSERPLAEGDEVHALDGESPGPWRNL